jgi:hypothetical protein
MSHLISAKSMFVVFLVTLSAACGQDPDVSTPEGAAEALAEEECLHAARCCNKHLGTVELAACAATKTSDWLATIHGSDGGDHPFDPGCVEALVRIYQAPCDAPKGDRQTRQCDYGLCPAGFFHGSKHEGEACTELRECDASTACILGTCRSPCGLPEGSPCLPAEPSLGGKCANGLVCAARTCSGCAEEGCTGGEPGANCDSRPCKRGLVCVKSLCLLPDGPDLCIEPLR